MRTITKKLWKLQFFSYSEATYYISLNEDNEIVNVLSWFFSTFGYNILGYIRDMHSDALYYADYTEQ